FDSTRAKRAADCCAGQRSHAAAGVPDDRGEEIAADVLQFAEVEIVTVDVARQQAGIASGRGSYVDVGFSETVGLQRVQLKYRDVRSCRLGDGKALNGNDAWRQRGALLDVEVAGPVQPLARQRIAEVPAEVVHILQIHRRPRQRVDGHGAREGRGHLVAGEVGDLWTNRDRVVAGSVTVED